jgi:hypothetical protein
MHSYEELTEDIDNFNQIIKDGLPLLKNHQWTTPTLMVNIIWFENLYIPFNYFKNKWEPIYLKFGNIHKLENNIK